MSHHVPKLSLVCPAYQEEEVLELFHDQLAAVLDRLRDEFTIEILYIDDGSRDRTLEVIKALARRDDRVRYLSLSRNFGHQVALTAGLEHARGDVIISMDSDLQQPPTLIPLLLAKWREGYDQVVAVRQKDPKLTLFKRLTSRAFYRILRLCSEVEVSLDAPDFRLMSRPALDALLRLPERHRFLRGMVRWIGFPTVEVPFEQNNRGGGVSKYDLRRMVNLAADGLLSFSRVPLRLSACLGALTLLFGLGYGVVGGLGALLAGREGSLAWVFLVASLYVLGGSILCGLGIVGEYVGRVFEQVKARPLYVLKDKSPDGPEDSLAYHRQLRTPHAEDQSKVRPAA